MVVIRLQLALNQAQHVHISGIWRPRSISKSLQTGLTFYILARRSAEQDTYSLGISSIYTSPIGISA